MGDRGRALPCFVREQPACNAGADRDHDHCAQKAAGCRVITERSGENPAEGFGQIGQVNEECDKRHQQISACHPGDDRFCHPADGLDAAKDNDENGNRSDQPADPFVEPGELVNAVAKAVCLNTVARHERGK